MLINTADLHSLVHPLRAQRKAVRTMRSKATWKSRMSVLIRNQRWALIFRLFFHKHFLIGPSNVNTVAGLGMFLVNGPMNADARLGTVLRLSISNGSLVLSLD